MPGAVGQWPSLAPLIGGSLNTRLIGQPFAEVLRLASSIKTGTVTASLILRKLGASPRHNSLARALREVGRLKRTLFTLRWLRDLALRRRTNAGLNKGEARNALARAVFFHRLGEIRDRSFENQRYRASGLNLVVTGVPDRDAGSRSCCPVALTTDSFAWRDSNDGSSGRRDGIPNSRGFAALFPCTLLGLSRSISVYLGR